MYKSLLLSAALVSTALAIVPATDAQSTDVQPAGPSVLQQPPAPIVHRYAQAGANQSHVQSPSARIVDSQPATGVWLRSESISALSTVSSTPQRLEIRLEHGRLNVNVHHPAAHTEILIDLPGGQVSLVKDGLYTFNSDTNTLRVLHGEAAAYPGPINVNARPIKVKEDHQLSLTATAGVRPIEAYPYELAGDLLSLGNTEDFGSSEYADGYPSTYGYAGAWGYPYPYGGFYPGYYPGFYGYPAVYGLGFGYYGGFHGGYGLRGGFRR